MKPSTIGLVCAMVVWASIVLVASVTQRSVDILQQHGTRSVYSDRSEYTAIRWLDENRNSFTCLMMNTSGIDNCGFDIQLGDGKQYGVDLTGYSSIRLEVEYRGPAEQFRVSFRNAFASPDIASDTKLQEFIVPVREGAYAYDIPFDNLQVPQWWIAQTPLPDKSYQVPDRGNVVHMGFDIQTPMPIGQHYFKILEFSVVAPWLGKGNIGWWVLATLFYGVFVGYGFHLYHNRAKQNARSAEMFDGVRKLDVSGRFRRSSSFDPLTGLLNRRTALHLIDEYSLLHSLVGTSILVLEIDHFNNLKEKYGTELGKEVLVSVSSAVKGVLRDGDAAVYWGGEQVVVICPNTNIEGGITVANKLCSAIKGLPNSQLDGKLTASVGVVNIELGESFDQALRRADEAMYKAKRNGRGSGVSGVSDRSSKGRVIFAVFARR